ncbi:hypothetical protein ACE1TF_19390 [Geomicrobium sp. JSM 1781026]|uniref:tubby C-terminal domain-like protein n=1 Tax=Geomicrobium sp. JSM 1781026 TaxID=3344580 RepID=UPI0035C16D18
MNSPRGFGIMLAFVIIIFIEPVRVWITGDPINESYWYILLGFGFLLAIVIIRFIIQAVRRNRARERNEELDGMPPPADNSGDLRYQEPIDMMHDHPVQIYNASGERVATYKYTFRTAFEKWSSLSGFMDFRDIEIKDTDTGDVLLFQARPLYKNFFRPKWDVYLNGEKHGFFEVARMSIKQVQKEMLFNYHTHGQKYQVVSPRLSTSSTITTEHATLMEIERTVFGLTSKGEDGNRGRKHEIKIENDDELRFIEKIGMYQQSMTRVRN